MKSNLSKAMKAEFYYLVIFIAYAIIEDRCSSALRHAGVKYQDKDGRDIKLSNKLNKMKSNSAFTNGFVRKRITIEFIDQIVLWKRERDKRIHSLASIPYDNEAVKDVAKRGCELVDVLDNDVRSVNRYYNKQYNINNVYDS